MKYIDNTQKIINPATDLPLKAPLEPGAALTEDSPNLTPAGASCGDPSDTECDAADTCDGTGLCQANLASDGTVCDDGNACTTADVCSGGGCTGGTQQVLISDPVLAAIGGVAKTEPLGALTFKGISNPVKAHNVVKMNI